MPWVLQGSPHGWVSVAVLRCLPLPPKTRQSFSNMWEGWRNKNIQFVGVSSADKLVFYLPGLCIRIEGLDYSAPSSECDPFPLVAALPNCEKGPGDFTNLPIQALDCPLGGESGDSLCAFIGDGVPSG